MFLWLKLTDAGNSETSKPVEPRLIFLASLFVASTTDLFYSTAGEPIASEGMKFQQTIHSLLSTSC